MTKVILLLLLTSLSSYSYANVYTVAAYDWEPFITDQRADGGIYIQLLRSVFQSQGDDIKLVKVPWSRALAMTAKGEIDILPGVWFTEKRARTLQYSVPHYTSRLIFVKHKDDNHEYTGIESLKGKTLAIMRNYAYSEELLNNPDIHFVRNDSFANNAHLVALKRVDLTLEDEVVAKMNLPTDLGKQLKLSKNALEEHDSHIVCAKVNPDCADIINRFNQGFQQLRPYLQLKH